MTTINAVRSPRRLGTLLLATTLAVLLGAATLVTLPALAAPAAQAGTATPAATGAATAVVTGTTAPTPAATTAVTATPAVNPSPAAPTLTTVLLGGAIVNGTAGASATQPLTVTIYSFDQSALNEQAPEPTGVVTETATGGRYEIDVEVPNAGVLLGVVRYNGITYRNFIVLDPGVITATMPITIYESTDDTAGLQLQQMHVVIEPAGTTANGLEVYALVNSADRTFSGTLAFTLPAGAQGVDFPQNPGQYVATADGFSGETVILPEGGSQIVATFQMPFDSGQLHVEHALSFAAESVILISLNTVELTGSNLQPMTMENLPAEYRAYDAGALDKGAILAFDARLVPGAAATAGPAASGTAPGGLSSFLAGLPPWAPYAFGAAIVLVVIGVAGWAWQRSRDAGEDEEYDEEDEEYEAEGADEEPGEAGTGDAETAEIPEEEEPLTREELLQAIADLDDAYEAGDLSSGEYKRQRSALKAQLAELRNDRNR